MLFAEFSVSPLLWIKLLHTVIWFFFVVCILALPVLGFLRRFRLAVILSSVVFFECLVLALNHFRCPLTELAAHYTSDRSPNFEIFLPQWLALHNKSIFGTIYAVGLLFALYRLFTTRTSPIS